MSRKFKWALVAIAIIAGNEILTWLILLVLTAPFAWNLIKEATEHD